MTKIYENYMDNRLDELKFVSEDNEKLKALASSVSLSSETIKGITYD